MDGGLDFVWDAMFHRFPLCDLFACGSRPLHISLAFCCVRWLLQLLLLMLPLLLLLAEAGWLAGWLAGSLARWLAGWPLADGFLPGSCSQPPKSLHTASSPAICQEPPRSIPPRSLPKAFRELPNNLPRISQTYHLFKSERQQASKPAS